ncbi:hypothetical protein PsYK624_043960 [Phanerochaete sordida]|uniref:Uncharacterized protein n=1 Tax=Phanerochaete sordida TaxID=48140 RepID=A0A9P3G4U5_9APHY|nr:hypothetical protein PsYK624_043960 [Phanerochaete sordida]
MQSPVLSLSMKGKVSWRPVFEYDNSENEGSITFRKKVTHITMFTARTFDREVNDAARRQTQHHARGSVSLDLSRKAFEVLGVVATEHAAVTTEYDAALRLVRERETEIVRATKQSTEQTYTIGPRSKLNLYQKIFTFAGLTYECDAVKASPRPIRETEVVDVTVKVRPVAFIRDIEVVYGDSAAQAPPVRVAEVHGGNEDINGGFGGKYVWLRPVYTLDPAAAASRFDLVVQDGAHAAWPDLAKGAGGQFRYLRAVRDGMAHAKMTHLTLFRGGFLERVDQWGWVGKTGDINGGRKGDFLYLAWKTQTVLNSVA